MEVVEKLGVVISSEITFQWHTGHYFILSVDMRSHWRNTGREGWSLGWILEVYILLSTLLPA